MHSYGFVIVPTLDPAKLNAADRARATREPGEEPSIEGYIRAEMAPFELRSRYGWRHGKFDYYEIGGRWDGVIENNRCSVQDYLSTPTMVVGPFTVTRLHPYMILTLDGEWFDREEPIDASEAGEEEWRAKARRILEAHRGMYIVTVDYHS
jgi:hypothetical protein